MAWTNSRYRHSSTRIYGGNDHKLTFLLLKKLQKSKFLIIQAIIPDTLNIKKSVNYDNVKAWLGEGLLTSTGNHSHFPHELIRLLRYFSTGNHWSRNRKLLTPAFHFSVLENFSETMSDKAEILCQCIEKRLKNNTKDPINIYKYWPSTAP